MPKLSIITINLNNAGGLSKTMQSVFAQDFLEYEYIIIDGGSNDGSLALIQSHGDKLAYWISEKDDGIYNAMNKGIPKAAGKYLLFLNSGDCLVDKHILKKVFDKGYNADILYGNILLDDGKEKIEGVFPETLLFRYFFNNSLPHACSFLRRSLFEKTGLYNEQNKIVSDWEFFILAINKYQCSYQYLPFPISIFNLDGISARKDVQQIIIDERKRALHKHFATFLPDYEAYEKLESELPRIKGMLGFRLHNRFKKTYNKIWKK